MSSVMIGLILEVLIQRFDQTPPARSSSIHAPQRVEKQRAFEILILGRRRVDAARRNDWPLVLDFCLVAIVYFRPSSLPYMYST
jgi:hypothetical protein